MSFNEKQLKLKTDELISKTVKINEANRALAVANQKLESKTAELDNSNRYLFESNRELAELRNLQTLIKQLYQQINNLPNSIKN